MRLTVQFWLKSYNSKGQSTWRPAIRCHAQLELHVYPAKTNHREACNTHWLLNLYTL